MQCNLGFSSSTTAEILLHDKKSHSAVYSVNIIPLVANVIFEIALFCLPFRAFAFVHLFCQIVSLLVTNGKKSCACSPFLEAASWFSDNAGLLMQIGLFLTCTPVPIKSCFCCSGTLLIQTERHLWFSFPWLNWGQKSVVASWKDKYSVFHICNYRIVATVRKEHCAFEL